MEIIFSLIFLFLLITIPVYIIMFAIIDLSDKPEEYIFYEFFNKINKIFFSIIKKKK